VYLHGKCRYCGAKVSLQYPIVELVGAFVGVLVYQAHPALMGFAINPFGFLFWFLVWMTLLFVVVYDIKHTIIPWSCSGLLAALAFFSLFFNFATFHFGVPTLWQVLAGPLLASPLFLLSLVSRGTWMGWGDSALELSLGWFLGVSMGFTALMLGFWIGAGVGLVLMALSTFFKRLGFFGYTISSEIPFAPFLVLGALLAHFFHVDFFSTLGPLF
jgi:leader peptidase (prepilin peptidase)/N-methyltransferase